MADITIDGVIDTYLKLRNAKAAIEAEAEEKVKGIKQKLEKIENYLIAQADKQGVTSFKTKLGTAFVTSTDYASVADWDAMLNFVKEREAYDLLERRVSKAAVRGYIEQDGAVPPGVNFGSKISLNVRKPTAKAEG